MSYEFGMFFVHANTFATALKKAQKFTEVLGSDENIEKLIENNEYYFPSIRYSSLADTEREKTCLAEADRRAIHQFFTLDFVYFHKAKLLALVGYRFPEAKKFFKKHVGFQNCCDQDYERDAWKGIKFFENIWDECNTMTPEQVLAYENKDCSDYTLEEIVEMLDYYKRSIAYEKIYDRLHLDDWLWGKNNEAFTRFSMNVITSQEIQWKAEQYAKCIVEARLI